MNDEGSNKLEELGRENKKLRFATSQWEQLERTYRKSNEDLQEAYAKLLVLQEKTDHALSGGDLAWWEWDYRTGKFIFNEHRARLLGYSPGDLPDNYNDITSMIHPDDYEPTMNRLQKYLNGETSNYESEFRLKNSAGEWRWFFDKGKIVEKDILGKPIRLAGVLIDVHERKNTESSLVIARDKAESENRSKSRFLASMSHEIYTPMAGVIGMAEILKQSKLSLEQEEYLNVIVQSATNLMSILNDIMEYSKLESGVTEYHEKPFSIHQVVEEVTASFLDRAAEKNLGIWSFQDPEIPHEVIGDPVRLRQVIRILTDNAFKFTEKGHIRIEAHFLEWDDTTVKVRFDVTDTGIGIPEEGMKRLFKSFSKLDTPESKKYGGGGLGLAIAKRLIDRMNGQIMVESELSEGTTFSFIVRFDRYKDTESPDPMREIMHGMRILILDPEPARAKILARYFDRWEAETEICSDPTRALQRIDHQASIRKPYSFIVIDHEQSGTSGIDLGTSIRHDKVVQKSILMLAGSKRLDIPAAELTSAGFVTFLSQPYTLGRLRHRLRDALSLLRKEPFDSAGEEEPLFSGGGKKVLKILLAEDNLINQKVALVILERIGHAADLAPNGRVAFELYKQNEYDLVLMDIQMPETDGLEATQMIREWEADNPGRVPAHICAITANRSAEDEAKCYAAGMNSYISKPFRLEELIKILNQL